MGQAQVCVRGHGLDAGEREDDRTPPKEVRRGVFYLLVFGSVCGTGAVEGVEVLLVVTLVA